MKDIPGYKGRYAATEDGQIWSYAKKLCGWNSHAGKMLKQRLRMGYLHIGLPKDNKWKPCKVHRLVAMTYLPNPHNYPVVRHLDNNKLNNHVSNLEWCTYKTNSQQAHADGLCPHSEKQRRAASITGKSLSKKVARFTIDGVFLDFFSSLSEAQVQTGIWNSNISKCIKGKISQTGGYKWKMATPESKEEQN